MSDECGFCGKDPAEGFAALAAADSVERPAVERLVAALRGVTEELTKFGDNIPELHNAHLALRAYEASAAIPYHDSGEGCVVCDAVWAARISTASKAPNTSELLLEEAEGIDDLVAEFGQQPTGDGQ